MSKLLAITLGAVVAVLASVWVRRRAALKKPRAIDPRIDEHPQSTDAQASHKADAGSSALRMILEHLDQSGEAPQVLTSEPSAPDLRDVGILSSFQAEEVAAGATGEVVAGALLVLEYPSEDSPVAVPAEPIALHPSADPVPPLSANGFLPDWVDEEVRKPKEKHASLASPRVARPKNEEMIAVPGTPVDLQEFRETAIPIPSSELAGVAEEMRAPGTAVEGPAQFRTSLGRLAATSSHRAPSSARKAASASGDAAKPPSAASEPLRKPRTFSEPVPSPTQKTGTKSERNPDPTPRTDSSLPIRLQLVFGSGGSVKKLVLIPHRGEGMPGSFEVTTVAGDRLQLSESSSDSYESLTEYQAA